MADNTTLNNSSGGDTIRSVNRSGVKTQVVQVDIGGAGAESLLGPAPMPVSFPQQTARVSVNPTITNQTYAANKVIGGILTFASILPASYAGILESIDLKFKASVQTVSFAVAIFDASPAGTFTDTNTAAINSADTAHLLGIYTLTGGSSVLGTHTIYTLDGIGKGLVGASTSLYVVVIPLATTATLPLLDMTVSLAVLQG